MNRYNSIKNAISLKSSDNKIIKTKSKDLIFQAKIDTKMSLVINNTCEARNQYGYINHLPGKLDDLKALQRHINKILAVIDK